MSAENVKHCFWFFFKLNKIETEGKMMIDEVDEVGLSWKQYISKVSDCSWGWPEGSLFDSNHTKTWKRVLLLSQDFPTLPFILTL